MNVQTSFDKGHAHLLFVESVEVDGKPFWIGHTTHVLLEDGTLVRGHIHSFNDWEDNIIDNNGNSRTESSKSERSKGNHSHNVHLFF